MKRTATLLCLWVILTISGMAQITPLYEFPYNNNLNEPGQYNQPAFDGTWLYSVSEYGGNDNAGAIFRVKPDGSDFELLHSFGYTPTNGRTPRGALTLVGNELYGTTSYGGIDDVGTLYKLNKDGSGFTLLHSFNNTDGANPQCKLTVESGFIYGTAYSGNGTSEQYGTLYSIQSDGSGFHVLHNFVWATGGSPVGQVLLDGSSLYGTTSYCGDHSYGTLYQFDLNTSTYTVLYHFSYAFGGGSTGGLYKYGNAFYGTAPYGGDGFDDGGVVFKYDPFVWPFYVVLKYFNHDGGFPWGSFEAVGTDLYFITQGGSYVPSRIYKLDLLTEMVSQVFDLTGPYYDYNLGLQPWSYGSLCYANGNLYGTCTNGPSEMGFLFKVSPTGAGFDFVLSYGLPFEGKEPVGDLNLDGDYFVGTTQSGGKYNKGVLFKAKSDGTDFQLLHNFAHWNGSQPSGIAAIGSGTYYGATKTGGAFNEGTLYRIDADGSNFSDFHHFSGSLGSYPNPGLIVYFPSGPIIGTTRSGGLHGMGTIFQCDLDGSNFIIRHDFNWPTGSEPNDLILPPPYDVVYGTTTNGGASGVGVLFSYNLSTHTYTVLKNFSASEGTYPSASLLYDAPWLYGTASSGGSNSYGTLFRIQTNGTGYSVLHHFQGTDGSQPRGSLWKDGDFVYGTTVYGGDNYTGAIFRFSVTSSVFEGLKSFAYTTGMNPYGGMYKNGDDFYGLASNGGYDYNGVLYQYALPFEWMGSISSDWSEPNNWSKSAIPTIADDVTIPSGPAQMPVVGSPVTNPAQCMGLTIQPGASLTISPGKALTVSDILNNSAGASGLTLESDATGTGSLIHFTQEVPATVERYLTGSADLTLMQYHQVAVPFNQPFQAGTFMGSYMYRFDPSGQNWVSVGVDPLSELDSYQGYMLYSPVASTTYSMQGLLNANSVFLSEGGISSGDFVLFPNPFASSLDWDSPYLSKSGVETTFWIWNPSSGNYGAYNAGIGVNGAFRYIPVGQAFFVKSTDVSCSILADSWAQAHSAQPFLKSATASSTAFRIKAYSNAYSDEAVIRFGPGYLAGTDAGDAAKINGNPSAPNLSSLLEDTRLTIQSLPELNSPVTIPLAYSSEFEGQADLVFEGFESIPADFAVKLTDNITGVVHDLRKQSVYSFMHQAGNTAERFFLSLGETNGFGESKESFVKMWIAGDNLYIEPQSGLNGSGLLEVFNSAGQRLKSIPVSLSGSSVHDIEYEGWVVARLSIAQKTPIIVRGFSKK